MAAGGRITLGSHGGAQVDCYGNLNSTVIGDKAKPKVRLPGAGGATGIASPCGRTFIVMQHNPRSFVAKLDFLTTLGYGAMGPQRRELAIHAAEPQLLVTGLCILEPEHEKCEFVATSLDPGVNREQVQANTGWPVGLAERVSETPSPSPEDPEVLRDLSAQAPRERSQA